MESKTTSKTSSLQALSVRAWRERWTDLQWGINIKTVLPRGVSGDVYNLADCILQQAVVGSGANQLTLSYLKHSLSAQLVSHAAVLQGISKYSQLHKTHCVYSLLEFLEGMLPGITCCGKSEEIVLATALLTVAYWLLQVLQSCHTTTRLLEKASLILKTLLESDFYVALMCLARYSETELFSEVTTKCEELKTCLSDKEVLESVKLLKKLDVSTLALPNKADGGPDCLMQSWIAIELIRQPGNPTQILVEQMQLLQRLKSYSDDRLYSELIRASLLSLQNVSQTPFESQWGAFAFLKVPHILAAMADTNSSAVVSAIELLLQHTPLLDAMDARCSCSCLECLLEKLEKAQLLTDSQVQIFLQRREVPNSLKLDTTPATAGIPKVIICAEPTLAGILKTLSMDYNQIQEALLGMLHQVVTGKSFELILAVATVQGQLQTLVTRLIRFNEYSKIGGDKARAQLFDISFLMLVSIVQNYGAETVLEPGGDSSLEQWVKECMVEANYPKPPEQLLRLSEPVLVNSLLQQFNSGEFDFKNKTPVKWQEVLFNMGGVMQEVLVAWERGVLLATDVKRILDAVRGRMYCLPVAAAAWLCAYMRTAPQDSLLKPVNMVQQLLAPPVAVDDNLRERWQLSCEIIRRMQQDVQLPLQPKGDNNVFQQPATEQLHNAWLKGIRRGWLDHNSARNLQCLLKMAGARWLVAIIVQELLQLRYRDQLHRGVDLAVAIFQLDMQACADELLSHVLPQQLHNSLQSDTLVEPQLSALARLSSYTVYAACDLIPPTDYINPLPPKIRRLSSASGVEQIIWPLRRLLSALEATVQDGQVTQQTYFVFQFLSCLVKVRSPRTPLILASIPPLLIANLLRTLPELFNPSLLLYLHDLNTTVSRTNLAKNLCMLRNRQLKKMSPLIKQ